MAASIQMEKYEKAIDSLSIQVFRQWPFSMRKQVGQWFVIAVLAALAGCSSVPERHPLPPEYANKASIPGLPEARFWGDEWATFYLERLGKSTDDDIRQQYPGIYGKPHHYLAISGGGENGAFGAGLLVGWSATGKRPEFTMVTGISIGALSAPFVFLGPDYDDELKEVFTTTTTKDIVKKRSSLLAIFTSGDSIADSAPLRGLIAKYFDAEVIDAIAREHKRGRRLYIGTTNLDAGRSVIWNIGAIAISDYPHKLDLIHDVLLASAAVPIAFPPVMIGVEAEGKQYDEMHVDGGTGTQVFIYPAAINWKLVAQKLKVQGKPKIYVIRNAFIKPNYRIIKRKVIPIASRTINSLIRNQGIGDLYQIYTLSMRDGNDFNLAYIPPDFTAESSEVFDPVYMRKLFERGYQMALEGYPWVKLPPGLALSP